MALAAKSPVMVYVAREPTVGGFTITLTPAVPAALIVYDGALAPTESVVVFTVKSVYVPAPGLVTPAIVTVTASPLLMLFPPVGIVSEFVPTVGVFVTKCHPPVVSVISAPLTPEKVVLPSDTVIEVDGPLAAVKPTV
jgi:hypothetical protein